MRFGEPCIIYVTQPSKQSRCKVHWIISSGSIFTRLPAIIVVVFVPRRYEIGCLRYLLRCRKKEETVVTIRSGERNELYHTAGISIGKRVPRARKPPLLSSSLSVRLPCRRLVILGALLCSRRREPQRSTVFVFFGAQGQSE